MAKHTTLLLLAVWVLAGELWLEAEGQEDPDHLKLCGRQLISICGEGPRWRRLDVLAQEAMDRKLDETVASSDWRTLIKSRETFYGGRPSSPGSPEASRDS